MRPQTEVADILSLHPHLHCIVPGLGGGVDKNGKWKSIRSDGKYLFPVKALSKVFRAKYVSLFRQSSIISSDDTMSCYKDIISSLFSKSWVVYTKRPFAHPSHVLEYFGRYTHKIAISNNRLVSYLNGKVRFSYKDYRHGSPSALRYIYHRKSLSASDITGY